MVKLGHDSALAWSAGVIQSASTSGLEYRRVVSSGYTQAPAPCTTIFVIFRKRPERVLVPRFGINLTMDMVPHEQHCTIKYMYARLIIDHPTLSHIRLSTPSHAHSVPKDLWRIVIDQCCHYSLLNNYLAEWIIARISGSPFTAQACAGQCGSWSVAHLLTARPLTAS